MGKRLEKVVGTLDKIFVPGSLFRMVREDINEGRIFKHKTFMYNATCLFEGLRLGVYVAAALGTYILVDAIQNMG